MSNNRIMSMSVEIQAGDQLEVTQTKSADPQGEGLLHVQIRADYTGVSLFGYPTVVAEALSDALTQVQDLMDRVSEENCS